jgi:hypothetical protein
MPRVRRKKKMRLDYTRQERNMLTHGVSFTCPRFGCFRRNNINWPVLEAAWRDLEAEILPEWIVSNPFTRPVGWLLFDAKQPRLPVVGEQAIESLEWSREHCHSRQYFFFDINRRLHIDDGSNNSEELFESEKQYLCRLNLLTDGERALL